jgi:hypothetical protein
VVLSFGFGGLLKNGLSGGYKADFAPGKIGISAVHGSQPIFALGEIGISAVHGSQPIFALGEIGISGVNGGQPILLLVKSAFPLSVAVSRFLLPISASPRVAIFVLFLFFAKMKLPGASALRIWY